MSNDKAEIVGEEMFIEELGQVHGGLSISIYTRGLNENGPVIFPRPVPAPPNKPIWIVGTPLPPVTTLMWGGGENAAVPPVPVPLGDR